MRCLDFRSGPNLLFTNSVKMYKSRIWKWGLDKKLKGDEVLAILILRRDRQAEQKETEFTIRGQPVDIDNINRYIKRNPSLVARFREGQVPSIHTMAEVQCRTPSPSPPRTLPPFTEVYRGEEVLGLFRDYIDGSFANGSWDCEFNVSCVSRISGDRSDELFERIIASFALVNRCLMRGDQINISEILNPAFESLKEVIATESPVFVVRAVCLLWYLDQHHKNDLLRLVLNYLTELIPIVLNQHHIMARIWRILGKTQFSNYYELSKCLYSMLVPLMETRIGPANFLTTILYGDHIDCLFHRCGSSESLALASTYRERVEATQMQHPWLTDLAITQTAVLCAAKEAEGRIEEAMECLQTLKEYNMSEEQEAVVNIQLGNYSYQTGDIPAAIRSYREATRLAVTVDGDERLLLTCLTNLESALSKGGKSLDAKRVHAYRLKRLEDFAVESNEFATRNHTSTSSKTACYADDRGLVASEVTPSWLWKEEEFNGFLRPENLPGETSQWLSLPTSPAGWTDSMTESQPETTSTHYPSLSPLLADWEDSPQDSNEWNVRCYE